MIASLIFPAVIAGVAVFFGSFLIWVVSKWHQEDVKPLPATPTDGTMVGEKVPSSGNAPAPAPANP